MSAAHERDRVNWILNEAVKSDAGSDRVVLENPGTVAFLDGVLRETYYPFIRAELEKTGFRYTPGSEDLHIDSEWLGPDLARKLSFILFDDIDRPFLQAAIFFSKNGYMFEREFHLGLPETTDPRFLIRILGEPHFAGNHPSLAIERTTLNPDWNTYFWIEIRAGSGFESGSWTMQNAAMGDIAQTIEDSRLMHQASMKDGFSTMEDVESFLEIARRSFQSSED